MAELLRWSSGAALQKKKDENRLSAPIATPSIRNPLQFAKELNNQIRANKANGFRLPGVSPINGVNNQQEDFQQQNDFQAQQAEQQRRQQEEEQRRQRIEQMRQQQEARQRQEQEKRNQELQARQQRQQQLLNSSFGGGLLSKMQNADKNPVTQNKGFDQPRPATVINQNMLQQLSKINGGNTTVKAFNDANRLAKLASDKLKQEENDIISRYGEEYRDALRQYNKASGDEQADLTERTKNALIDQREKLRRGDSDASTERIKELNNLVSLYENHGRTKGKSFGKQLSDWLTSGGIAGDIGGNNLTEALGNVTGKSDETRAHLEKLQNKREDLGAVGAANAVLGGIANTGLNLSTGGTYGLANAGVGAGNTLAGLDDKVLDYDAFGKPYMRDKKAGEQIADVGNAALNVGFALAGKAGVGPGLGNGSVKDIARYAWQEPAWAGATSVVQEGLENLRKGKGFGEYDLGELGKSFATNVGQDIGMDLFNLGQNRARTRVQSQMAQEPNNATKKLADAGYDISENLKAKAEQTAKKAIDFANDHSLGGTTKIVDGVDGEPTEKSNRIPLDESIKKINNVKKGRADSEVIGRLPVEYMNKPPENPNIDYLSRIVNKKIMAGDAKNLSVAELAYSANNYSKAKIIEFEKNGTGRLNIIRPIRDGKAAIIALEKQPNGNTLVTTIRPNADSNYVRNIVKNKNASVLYDTTDGAATASITDESAASRAMANNVNRSISQNSENVNVTRRKVMNLPETETTAPTGRKMTSQEFFEANKINSNDLASMKKSYPNEVKTVEKLIKSGVTPETFDNAVLSKKGGVKSAYKGDEIAPLRAMFNLAYDYNTKTDDGATKNQKKANVFGSEAIKENTTNKSRLADNISKDSGFSEEVRNRLANNPIEYKPTTNEERLARANEILSTKSLDEVDKYLRDNYFDVKDKYRNSGDTVLAGEYAKMLDADGQYGRATEVIQKMSKIATKQGQQIQALSILSNRSPEGIANMAQNAIQKGGGKVDGETRKQIISNTQEIGKIRAKRAELTTENENLSYRIMEGDGDLKALRKRQMEIAQEYRTCLDQEGREFAKLSETVATKSPNDKSIFGSIWRAGLLSGPRTHVGNAVSNTFQNALNASADRLASGIDWARTRITGKEREVVSSAGGRSKGLKRGMKAAGEVLKSGTNLWEGTEKVTSGNASNAWGFGGEMKFKNKIADAMIAKPTNFVFRAMSAGDLPFRYSAFENAIRTEAKRQGMNLGYKGQALQDYINSRVATPDPDLQAYGIKKGNESVYDADTFLSRTMSSLDQQINKIDNKIGRNVAKTAKTLIAPFVKVPSKVLSTAIDYSPIGSVQAIVKKVGSKKYTTAQFETDLARSGLGTGAFVGLGYALSSAGLLTGGYPDDNDERNRWKAEGIEPNSVKIGDKYVSLNYLGPAAILMGMGAGVQKRQERGEDPFTVSVGAIGDTFNSFFEQSYVQGLNSAINAVKDSQRYGESYANSLARGLVPNLLRQTAVATDDKQRQVDNPLEAITSGIPGLAKTLDAKVDTYGREIENKQTLPLGQMWDALKISNSRKTNDVIDEVSRLHKVDPSNKDLQVTPPTQSGSISVDGVNVKITDDQKSQLQKDIGNAAITAMRQVINSPEYSSLSDTDKATALDKARSEAQKQARKQFIEKNNITADKNDGARNSGGSVDGEYAKKAITGVTANTEGKKAIIANNSLSKEGVLILDKYNSMSKDDWEDYINGSSAESAAAEYNLAKAKYDNQIANDELNDAQKIRKEKELRKLEVSKDWEKKYRDAYGLANSKSDMQEYLASLDDDARAETVGILNGLNRAMYDAGVIKASTYKSRSNAINNASSSGSGSKKKSGSKSGKGSTGMSSEEASALSSLAKTMVKNTSGQKASTPKAPETKRKMASTKSSGNKTGLKTYSTNLATKGTITKGAKKSIA